MLYDSTFAQVFETDRSKKMATVMVMVLNLSGKYRIVPHFHPHVHVNIPAMTDTHFPCVKLKIKMSTAPSLLQY